MNFSPLLNKLPKYHQKNLQLKNKRVLDFNTMQAKSTNVSASKTNSINVQPSAYEILKQKLAGYSMQEP